MFYFSLERLYTLIDNIVNTKRTRRMVKNTVGGKKGKSMANKGSSSGDSDRIRFSQNEFELYACVTKVFGSGMFEVTTNDNKTYVAYIRGKMKGPHKRNNFISLYNMVLVGLRPWESIHKNVDILFIFSSNHIHTLQNIPNLNLNNILNLHFNHTTQSDNTNNDLFSYNNSDNIPPQTTMVEDASDEEVQEEFNFDEI